jgi:hypothetical protein
MNNRFERMLKEVFVAECEMLSRSLSGGTEENHINNQLLQSVSAT